MPASGVDPGTLLLSELMEYRLEVRVCGKALNDCQLDESNFISGVPKGSMKALAGWVMASDIVLIF